jgi:hypothetical protein
MQEQYKDRNADMTAMSSDSSALTRKFPEDRKDDERRNETQERDECLIRNKASHCHSGVVGLEAFLLLLNHKVLDEFVDQ